MNKTPKNWTPPDHLDRSRPREVRLTGNGYALLVLSVVLIIGGVVGAIAITAESRRQFEEREMLNAGADADATVTRLWRAGESKTPWVAYTFTFAGNSYSGQSRTRLVIWEKLSVGGVIPVRFAPDNPQVNAARGPRRGPLPKWVGSLVGALSIGCGSILMLPIRSQRRLLADGRAARGQITKHKKTGHGTTVYYDFVLLSGATAQGRSDAGKKPAGIGSPVCVLYDSENPRRTAVYPMSLVRLGTGH